MTKPITVSELHKMCEDILLQYWDKHIMISADDEWNDYHWLYFWFTVLLNDIKDLDEYDSIWRAGLKPYEAVILG
jgi:hypothetical protein